MNAASRALTEGCEKTMPKYLLGTTFQPGLDPTPMEEWTEDGGGRAPQLLPGADRELSASGELVETAVLAGPDLAKIVTSETARVRRW